MILVKYITRKLEMNLKNFMLNKRMQTQKTACSMIPFISIIEQVKLSDGHRNQNSGCLWVDGWNWVEKSRRELSRGDTLDLDWDDGYMGAYICQKSSKGILICVFYCV